MPLPSGEQIRRAVQRSPSTLTKRAELQASPLEVLMRKWPRPSQFVRVEHVHVNEGGQATIRDIAWIASLVHIVRTVGTGVGL